jgi:hypothetical protein
MNSTTRQRQIVATDNSVNIFNQISSGNKSNGHITVEDSLLVIIKILIKKLIERKKFFFFSFFYPIL